MVDIHFKNQNHKESFFVIMTPVLKFFFSEGIKTKIIKILISFKAGVLITGKIKPPGHLPSASVLFLGLRLRCPAHPLCRNIFFFIRSRNCELTCNENYPSMISSPIWQTPRVFGNAADISDDHLNWIEPLNIVILKHVRQSKEEKE